MAYSKAFLIAGNIKLVVFQNGFLEGQFSDFGRVTARQGRSQPSPYIIPIVFEGKVSLL
jgi:hypothetical protein